MKVTEVTGDMKKDEISLGTVEEFRKDFQYLPVMFFLFHITFPPFTLKKASMKKRLHF